MSLYPKAPLAPPVLRDPVDADEIARRIIEGIETGKITFPFDTKRYGNTYELPGFGKNPEQAKPHFLGPCLRLPDDPTDLKNPGRGSNDMATFNQVWKEIHRDKLNLAKVRAVSFSTKAQYILALGEKAKHLDPQKWADGAIAAAGVADFAALKTKLTEGIEL